MQHTTNEQQKELLHEIHTVPDRMEKTKQSNGGNKWHVVEVIIAILVICGAVGTAITYNESRLRDISAELTRSVERIEARISIIERSTGAQVTAYEIRRTYEEGRIAKLEDKIDQMDKNINALRVQLQQLEQLFMMR